MLLREKLFVSKIVFIKQSTKHDYFRIMISGKLNNLNDSETAIDEICIWDEQKQYTREFVDLLKDYYLNL